MKKHIILLVSLIFCKSILAQNVDTLGTTPSFNQRELQVILQQWSITNNAAGLAFANVNKGGLTILERAQSEGNHHRVQQGSLNRGIRFFSEGYSKFNDKIFTRGQFVFHKNLEYDRAWSDVANTYNANPYIFGSSVRGNYDQQKFDLNVKVYTTTLGRTNLGLALDYKVADISRQRDPRSRSFMLDYAITPSVVYTLSDNSKLGINAFYRFDKEDMPNLSTVQTDPNLRYYTFSGLHHAQGRIGGYRAFKRRFVSDYLGADLQYQYAQQGLQLLVSGGFHMQWQETLGDKKQSPGSFNAFNYNILTSVLIRNDKFLHKAQISGSLKDGGADEYRQSLHSERDPITGTSTEYWKTDYIYKNRFVVKTTDINLAWKSYALRTNQQEYRWSIGAMAAYESFSNIYYLPQSEYAAEKLLAGLEGSCFVFNKNDHRVELEAMTQTGYSLDTRLELSHETEISEQILRPDLDFHSRNTLEVQMALKYTFPMRFSRKNAMSGYARLYAGNLFAKDSANWTAFGFSIGLLTL